MMSRSGSEPPRLEPDRSAAEETEFPAPDRTLRDELRQWGIRKTFVHQFRLMAARIIPTLAPKKRGQVGGDRYHRDRYERDHLHPHKRVKTKPKKKKGQTTSGHTADDPARPPRLIHHVVEALFSVFSFD